MKKLAIMSLACMLLAAGCGNAVNQSGTSRVGSEQDTTTTAEAMVIATPQPTPTPTPVPTPTPDPLKEQIETLSSLLDKDHKAVIEAMGKPIKTKHLENTDTLLVDYYDLEYKNDTAKVQVVYSDDKQVVNYISYLVIAAEDVDTLAADFKDTLTKLYGEGSVERTVRQDGKKNTYWKVDGVKYEVNYSSTNFEFNIFPM